MSEANRVSLIYVPEATYGTTPPNSTGWKPVRFTDTNLAAAPRTVISDEIRSDRHVSDLVVTGLDVQGDVGFELHAGTFDDWLEALMGGTWATNVLKAGTTARSFSIQEAFNDWTTVQYLQWKGMRVGAMDLDIAFGEVVKGKFSFQGNNALQSTTSLVGTGSVAAANSNDVMDAAAGVTAITLDGGAPGAAVKRVSLRVENNLRPIEGVGTAAPTGIAYGRSIVTGSIEMYFETIAMYNKLLSNSTAAMSITITKSTKSYTFLVPKMKFNSGSPPVQGTDTDVMIPLEFTALYDGTTELTNLKITRVP